MNCSKIQRLIGNIWIGVGVLILIAIVVIMFILQKEEFYSSIRTALIIYVACDIVIKIGTLISKRSEAKQNDL